jgi:hypothetical protein
VSPEFAGCQVPATTENESLGSASAFWGVILRNPAILATRPCALRQPLISIGLAYEALDVSNFSPGTMGLNLPIAIGDALARKDDAGRFFHAANMACESLSLHSAGPNATPKPAGEPAGP